MPSVQGLKERTIIIRITVFRSLGWSSKEDWMPPAIGDRSDAVLRTAMAGMNGCAVAAPSTHSALSPHTPLYRPPTGPGLWPPDDRLRRAIKLFPEMMAASKARLAENNRQIVQPSSLRPKRQFSPGLYSIPPTPATDFFGGLVSQSDRQPRFIA